MSLKNISIKEIKHDLDVTLPNELSQKLEIYRNDSRLGVKKIVSLFDKKYNEYLNEIKRVLIMKSYEDSYEERGYKYIAGIDEVGRGPLAGPVVACAVILKPNAIIMGVDDSKKLSETKRCQLFEEIQQNSVAIGIGIVDVNTIDEINISCATFEAMKMAVGKLKIKPDFLLVDGFLIPQISYQQKAIIKGDTLSASIAAASIIAKVTRDEMMLQYDKAFPKYCFASNKGYGTKEHINAIKKYGITSLHRKTFVKNFI